MHRRLRWGNVAKAAGAALAVALVVAWPRLAPSEPALPGTEPAPLDDQGGRPPLERVDGAKKRGRGGERRRRTARAGGRGARRGAIRARAERAARRRTSLADGRDRAGSRGRGGESGPVPGDGEGGTTVPDMDDEGETTVAGGGDEGAASVPERDDEGVATPDQDPAPVEFGFERP